MRAISLPPFTLWETRAGEGTPIVLIHGLSGSSDWWRRNFDALSREHEVGAVDLVGFGRSRRFVGSAPLPLAFEEITALLARWIAGAFREPVHLVGHSMGGQTAIHLAAERPDLVRSLTLVGSTGIPVKAHPISHARELAFPPASLSFGPVLVRDAIRASASILLATVRLLRDDARPAMRAVSAPTLLLWGDRDPLVPRLYAEQMLGELPAARLVVLERAGHVAMWDNAEVFNRELLAFVEEVERLPRAPAPRGQFSWGLAGSVDGIRFRQSGRSPAIVLVHGLGMSSRYFRRLAQELHGRGVDSIAVDLRGFGESANAPARDAENQAREVLRVCGETGIGTAVWLGHSTGCDVVAAARSLAPERVTRAVYLSPDWTRRDDAMPVLMLSFLSDIPREPFALIPQVAREYWRAGVWRWWRTLLISRRRPRIEIDDRAIVIIGRRDPLAEWPQLLRLAAGRLRVVDGAHAINFSHAKEVADVILERFF